jgi:hypothetical protein
MKTTIIISLLSLTSLTGFCQAINGPVNDNTPVCRKAPNMPTRAIPAWPQEAYIPLEDKSCAPCYEYRSKRGTMRMECPFIMPVAPGYTTNTTTVDVQGQNTYTGNYPVCKEELHMPANAKAVFPSSEYTSLGTPGCAPCYEYTTRHGLTVMECPNAMLK